DGRAYERFTPSGPVALLPVADRFALVWSMTPQSAADHVALDDGAFLAALQAHFGDRAGRFVSVERRASFPLRLRSVDSGLARRADVAARGGAHRARSRAGGAQGFRRTHDPRELAMSAGRIVVAGGGPVGLAFACACDGFEVRVLEASDAPRAARSGDYDLRV